MERWPFALSMVRLLLEAPRSQERIELTATSSSRMTPVSSWIRRRAPRRLWPADLEQDGSAPVRTVAAHLATVTVRSCTVVAASIPRRMPQLLSDDGHAFLEAEGCTLLDEDVLEFIGVGGQ